MFSACQSFSRPSYVTAISCRVLRAVSCFVTYIIQCLFASMIVPRIGICRARVCYTRFCVACFCLLAEFRLRSLLPLARACHVPLFLGFWSRFFLIDVTAVIFLVFCERIRGLTISHLVVFASLLILCCGLLVCSFAGFTFFLVDLDLDDFLDYFD